MPASHNADTPASSPAPPLHKRTRRVQTPLNSPPIDITKEEFDRISSALHNAEFRKMFLDYVEEIQDPANRKIYEEEIIQLEKERGVDVKFVAPEPGFVVNTSADGVMQCFVNIAQSSVVERPSNQVHTDAENGKRGLSWSIPMAQGSPRDDLDAHGKRCQVYDVVFHPDALHLAERNSQFRQCIVDTALDAVEREFKVKLDRTNLKFPTDMKFKGVARPTVIRKLMKDASPEQREPHPLETIFPERPTAGSGDPKVLPMKTGEGKKLEFCEPNYKIKYRRNIDLTEMTDAPDAKLNILVPTELVVDIELPLLQSTADCKLDVTERSVYLLSELPGAKYRLKIDLPHVVDDKEGSAKFDVDKRCLRIVLPVVRGSPEQEQRTRDAIMHLNREDSGVESDGRDETNPGECDSPPDAVTKVVDGDKSPIGSDTSTRPAFLSKAVMYNFPAKFDCNVLDNVMSLVLHVRNVQQESIALVQHEQDIHLKFTSIGSGYCPTWYAFYLQMPKGSAVQIESAEAEAWENNVVLNLHLAESGENVHSYFAGVDSADLKKFTIQQKFQLAKRHSRHSSHTSQMTALAPQPSLQISVERSDCKQSVEIEIKPRNDSPATYTATNADEGHTCSGSDVQEDKPHAEDGQHKKKNKQKKKNKKRRSLSESACDDFKEYHQQKLALARKNDEELIRKSESISVPKGVNVDGDMSAFRSQQRKQRSFSECRDNSENSGDSTLPPSFKGILKHYSRYGGPRPSISESCSSSVDDSCSSYSCSMDAAMRFSSSIGRIPEENTCCDGLSESCKKTVRFNEVIRKQVFRLDSSILGQRKKNQKRRDRKLKALQRRLSEGDSADYEENKATHNTISRAKNANILSNITNKSPNNHHDSGLDLSQTASEGDSKNEKSKYKFSKDEASDLDSNRGSMMFEMDM